MEEVVSAIGLEGALARLAEEEAELGSAQPLLDLRARLEDRSRRKREAEIAELLEGARALIEAEAFEDALDLIERARRLDPSHAESAWLMAAGEEGAGSLLSMPAGSRVPCTCGQPNQERID